MALSLQKDYPLLKHNTFGIDVKAACFAQYHSRQELRQALEAVRGKYIRLLNVGAGSNLLFCGDFEGAVLHNAITSVELLKETPGEVEVRLGGGLCWDSFVATAIDRGWYGAENLSGIPGDVASAAVQNIGAYGAEFKDLVVSVETVDSQTGLARMFRKDVCGYSYRHSIFKLPENRKYIVTYVVLRLSRKFTPNLSYKALSERFALSPAECTASGIRAEVVRMRAAKLPDPAFRGNAGSFFMNPVVSGEVADALSAKYPDMPRFGTSPVKLSAAWLIEGAGWKGRCKGPAGVWDRQPLVLVNMGGASGVDILSLADEIAGDVFRKYGVELKMEVNVI